MMGHHRARNCVQVCAREIQSVYWEKNPQTRQRTLTGICWEKTSLFSDQFRRGESEKDRLKGVKSSKLVSGLSDLAWKAFQSVNTRLPEGEAIRPKWAPGPLLKSYER